MTNNKKRLQYSRVELQFLTHGLFLTPTMDELFFFGFLLLLFLCGPWIGIWILRKKFRRQEQRLEERFSSFTQRIFALETAIRALQSTPRVATEPAIHAPAPIQ